MEIIKTNFEGVLIIKQDVFSDSRGKFCRIYSTEEFKELGLENNFVEDNYSSSNKGVLRGLHFQRSPFSMGKLVYVTQGAVLDVIVDLRKYSPTYKKWFSYELSSSRGEMLFIPKGFGHGFLTISDNTLLHYKYTNKYNKDSEFGLMWNDPEININWNQEKYGILQLIISDKDQQNISFRNFESLNISF